VVKADMQMAHDQGSNPGAVYWMDVSELLAITFKKKLKVKVTEWGTPKKIFKKNNKKSTTERKEH
jgi:hypothetical protein